jgi:Putative zinc-finger
MCNKELLVAFLYEDLNDIDRAKVEMHLRACEACRDELAALRGVRIDLATWAPPLPDLGFRIVRDVKPVAQGSWRAWWTPAAGLAAAATLVLAAALSLAHVEIRSGPDGVTVRTGVSTSGPEAFVAGYAGLRGVQARDVYLPNDENLDALGGIVRRIDALEAAIKEGPQTRNAALLSARASDEELIKHVHDLLAQSESRQQGELAMRLAQVIRDFDNQRRADLQSIQAGFARLDNNMTREAQLHTDLVNFVTTTAGKQK